MNTATTTATASFTKLADDTWGIQGFNLTEGQPVVIVKRDGTRQDAFVGAIVTECNEWGKTVARKASAAPRVTTAEVTVSVASNTVTEAGFYLLDNQAYKVIESRDGSFFYARMVTGRGLKKAPGVFNRLTPANKMTPAQIAAYGVRTKVCVNCSATLTDPASQGVGLGTKCGPDILGTVAYRAAYKAAKAAAEAAQVAADAAAAAPSATPALDRLRSQPSTPIDPDEAAFRQGWEEASDEGNRAEAELAAREIAEGQAAEAARRPRSQWESIYFAMADMGFSDSDIRDARYGRDNW